MPLKMVLLYGSTHRSIGKRAAIEEPVVGHDLFIFLPVNSLNRYFNRHVHLPPKIVLNVISSARLPVSRFHSANNVA
jgi:hypothetical protein